MKNEEQNKIKYLNEKLSVDCNQNLNNKDEEKIDEIINNNENYQKVNEIKNNKEQSKKNVINKYADQLIIEKLKLLYNSDKNQLDKKDKIRINNISIKSENSENKNENLNQNVNNSQGDEAKYNKKMTIYIKDIRNKSYNIYDMSEKNFPKKLNLKEIFKKMNIDQIASNVNEQKRNDIIKIAKAKREEEKNNENNLFSQKKENVNINKEEQNKIKEINNGKESIEKSVQQNIKEIKNAENSKIDNPVNRQSFISSLNEIYNKKINTINNNIKDKKIKKLEKSKIDIFEVKTINSNIENKKKKEFRNNNVNKDSIEIKKNIEEIQEDLQKNKNIKSINENKEEEKKDIKEKGEIEINEETKNIEEINDIKETKEITENKEYKDINKVEEIKEDITSETKNLLYVNDEENIFLESKISKNVQNSSDNPENSDKFLESFFIASFSTSNGKILSNSEILPSDCEHEICSKLPAMEPEIIYKYPSKTKNIEINNLAASICFPNGIKLCYEQEEDKIKIVKNYRSTLTNQTGQMFFVYTFHFYLKMINEEFCSIYKMTPIRYQMSTYQDELSQIFNDELEEDIVKNLELYSKLNFNEIVYIPFCLGIVSKYPYYHQMEKCLESIFESMKNKNNNIQGINELIINLIESIPFPVNNSKISFSLPYVNKICEINYPFYKDILLFGNNPMIILEKLNINNIISFFKLLLFEQRILVIGKDIDIVSEIILNFLSLMYPFEWIHTYIPVMSIKMLKFLQSFLPFFNGMNITLFNEAKKTLSKLDDVYIINIDEDIIDTSSNLREKQKFFKGSNYISKNFPAFPKGLENALLKELKLIKIELEKYKNYNIFDKLVINNRIKNLFFHFFVEILYDYNKYSYNVDNYPVFNAFSMINEKPNSDKNFYTEITSAQSFQMFIQKALIDENGKLYIDERIKEYLELQKQGNNTVQIMNKQCLTFHNEYLSSQKINKNYIIKPYLIPNYHEYEEDMRNNKKCINFKDIKEFIYSQNFLNDNTNNNKSDNANKPKNKKIIDKFFILNNKDDPASYLTFTLPNNLIINKTEIKIEEAKEQIPIICKRSSTKIKIISGEKGDNQEYRYSSFYSTNSEKGLSEEQKETLYDDYSFMQGFI